jgi:hypothetical protein
MGRTAWEKKKRKNIFILDSTKSLCFMLKKNACYYTNIKNICSFTGTLSNYVRPDYPSKLFPDRRNMYFLLMETLAEHS